MCVAFFALDDRDGTPSQAVILILTGCARYTIDWAVQDRIDTMVASENWKELVKRIAGILWAYGRRMVYIIALGHAHMTQTNPAPAPAPADVRGDGITR